MLQTNENVFRMWDTLISFLDSNPRRWNSFAPFARGVDRLRSLRAAASTAGQRQEQGSEGSTQNKGSVGDRMVNSAMLIANNAHAYAISAEDDRLETATDFSATSLRRMAEGRRADAVDALITAVTPHVEQLEDYRVSLDNLTALSALVREFRATIGQPGADIANKKTATADADDIRRDGQFLIKKTLDKLVRNFEGDDPGFVSNYFNARVVRDYGHRGSGGDSGTAQQ